MAEAFIFHVLDDRTLEFRQTEPIMLEDNNVTEFIFRIPKTLNELDVSSWSWWFVYKNANGDKYSSPLLLTDDTDEPDLYSNATYWVDHGFTQKAGRVKVALEALNIGTGDAPTNEWHTKTYIIDVNDTLQGNQIEFKPSEVDIISGMLQSTLNQIREMIETGGGCGTSDDIENKSTVSGATVTDALSSLSDQIANEQTTRADADASLRSAIDALVSPSGQSVVVDSSLSISGAAADAKVTGEALSNLKSDLDIVASSNDYAFPKTLNGYCVEGYAYASNGAYTTNATIICTSKFRLKSDTVTCGSNILLYALFDSNGVFIERVTVSPSQKTVTITRSNAKYIALMFNKNSTPFETVKASNIQGVYIEKNDTTTLEVGAGKEYTTVLAAFRFAEKITDRKVVVNIYEGDYDIYDELGGDDFLASISSSATWKSGIQPVFTGDIEINGIGNVILRMEIPYNIYTQYTYQATRLSQINNSGNIKISNITFISKNNRYAIHDECDNVTKYANTKHEYIDCKFYSVNGSAVIGIGASTLSDYLLKNCYLKNTTAITLYFHNWSNTKKGNLIVADSVLENSNELGSGIKLGVNSNYLFDVFVSSSYLHSLKVASENASEYSNSVYRIICINTNLSSVIIDSTIISSTYDPVFKTW